MPPGTARSKPASAPADGEMRRLRAALAADRDVWGEEILARAEDPSYDAVAPLLPPLGQCRLAPFAGYPLVLSLRDHPEKIRVLSAGSRIDLAIDRRQIVNWVWHEGEIQAEVLVSPHLAPFGLTEAFRDGPVYVEGYLPIVQWEYRYDGVCYRLEIFAAPPAAGETALCAWVKLSARALPGGPPRTFGALRLTRCPEALSKRGSCLVGNRGPVYAVFSRGATVDAGSRTVAWEMDLQGGKTVARYLLLPNRPEARWTDLAAGPRTHAAARSQLIRYWQRILREGTQIETPEPRVNQARNALVIGSFMLASGDELRYSAHNVYELLYLREAGDATLALALWGHFDAAERYLRRLLRHRHVYGGIELQEQGFKLQFALKFWQLTRRRAFLAAQLNGLRACADAITRARRGNPHGLLPAEEYCDDIKRRVYPLSQNANAWSGLRACGLLLEDGGHSREAERYLTAAREFRAAIRAAVDASSDYTYDPPFVASMLYGSERPYPRTVGNALDRAFDGRWVDLALGSYYNLMMPYVLESGLFPEDDPRRGYLLDYFARRGSLFLGLIRFDHHLADEEGTDDLYGLRYKIALVRAGRVREALLAFYARMAHGMTRDTYIGCEVASLDPRPGQSSRFLKLPPNSADNGNWLQALRHLLVIEHDRDDDGRPEELHLLPAVPRDWLADGCRLRFTALPTVFGPVSLEAHSQLGRGRLDLALRLPRRQRLRQVRLTLRLPLGYAVKAIAAQGIAVMPGPEATGTLLPAGLRGNVHLAVTVRLRQNPRQHSRPR